MPVFLLTAFLVWAMFQPIDVIDGKPDNAPRNAAMILLLLTPIIYVMLTILNAIDMVFDRFGRRRSWIATLGLWIVISLVVFCGFDVEEATHSPLGNLQKSLLIGLLLLLPMTFLRRFALHRADEISDLCAENGTEQVGASDRDKPPS